MQPRIDLVTLGVPDLDAARRFYVDGLGWKPFLEVPGEVVFLQVGHGLGLALWGAAALQADVHGPAAPPPPAMTGISLAQIVGSPEEVAEILDRAVAAGGTALKQPQPTDWGGYHAYFADPAGFQWEIAINPDWHVDEDGRVTMGDGQPGT